MIAFLHGTLVYNDFGLAFLLVSFEQGAVHGTEVQFRSVH